MGLALSFAAWAFGLSMVKLVLLFVKQATNMVFKLASASGRVTVITGRHTAVLTLACTITLRLSRFVALTMSFKHIQPPANFLPPPFAHPYAVR